MLYQEYRDTCKLHQFINILFYSEFLDIRNKTVTMKLTKKAAVKLFDLTPISLYIYWVPHLPHVICKIDSSVLFHCCNLSTGIAFNVWFTTNGMCAKNNNMYTWHEQAIIKWLRDMISIVACCHSVKLCAHAARAFRSQQNGAVTRMWRSCRVKPSQKERAIGEVRCKKEGML